MHSRWIAIAAILLALAVACGAFGAHSLRARLDQYSLQIFEKAVFYHFVHALGILIVSVLMQVAQNSDIWLVRVNLLLLGGIILFSGSLYLLAISGMKWLGAITPLGGSAFILAWLLLAWRMLIVKVA